ncbi:MAG: hypothetical protein H7Y31_15345 [Chitinophagaceae bacterium]|nr:hypothetical protein [Chitinophagaceae bacterium]
MKIKLLFLILLFPWIAGAQKVDLDRFNFSSQFRTLPQVSLDSSYRTYSVAVESTRLMQNFLQEMTPEKSVLLQGWRQLNNQAHISIKVKLEDLLPESVSVKERVEVQKDKTGKVISQKTLYCQEVVYTFAANAEITDYKGAHVRDVLLADRGYKQTYKSPEFALKPMADGYFMLNALTVTGQLYRNCVNRAVDFLSARLTEDFGYGEHTVNDFMWILDTKKHPEYAAHRNAFLTMKDVLFNISANRPIDGIRKQLEPVIKYFESIKKNYPSTSKHDRKLRYASYYNLAKLYYYLDDPQAMMKEASGLVLNDFDARDGRALEESAIRLKNLFDRTQIYTRHFPIDVTTLRGPYESTVNTQEGRNRRNSRD